MDTNLEHAQELLRESFPVIESVPSFLGVSCEEFEKEDLIRLILWNHKDMERLQENHNRSNQMYKMFADLRITA